ncbi:hypothetical protein MKJ04_18740 [Pontibacter sp. E15-1]|uniref:hypothetical protein n=1 Tax=Pontibacter sp. E15-1 TaxID=2919918 RepID=UPI001F4FD786|nr:hypothetical protein [Pontibacter sp. E15-1]MCJ8166889.1 hypothetical protein [Pontibacter sp. E15-1]
MNYLPVFFRSITAVAVVLLFQMCQPNNEQAKGNPPMEGFNEAASDAKAIQLADSVMAAQGGRQSWDNTRYIAWNFFGNRKLLWDKATGDVRVEYLKEDAKTLVNINTGEGKVYRNGTELTQPDSVAKYLQRGKEAWVNDSYWLVMPYKLKDSGVTLKYLGEETTQAGQPADVLQLTFDKVGVTPENRYKVFVDKETKLVSQWAYFPSANDTVPAFVMPWQDYKMYDGIKLSGDRGQAKITDIQVLKEVPKEAFTSFAPVQL